jgi:hypothetical protein
LQQADVLFLSDMAKYMKNDPAAAVYPHATLSHLMWWSWNPNSGDTGGIVQDDWLTVSHLSIFVKPEYEFEHYRRERCQFILC